MARLTKLVLLFGLALAAHPAFAEETRVESKRKAKAKSEARATWFFEGETFGALLGPITYDRSPEGPAGGGPDRQLASRGFAIRAIRLLDPVATYARLQWRSFPKTENVVETRQESGPIVGTSTHEMSAQGPGFGLGISRRVMHGRWFLPYAGVVYENSQLSLRGTTANATGGSEPVDERSVLHVFYADTGVAWRLWHSRHTSVTIRSAVTLPFYQNGARRGAQESSNRTSTVSAVQNLHHRASPGAELGLAVGFAP